MTLQLSGYNFEAYPQFTISIDGFVGLTGESNAGKSSIIRAFRAVLLNEFHPDCIRLGAKECVLELEFIDEPHDVLLVKRKKTARANTCEITMRGRDEPIVYGKAGNGLPKELQEIGFSLVKTADGEHEFDLTFHRQFDQPVFLIQDSEPTQAALIHNIYGLDQDEADLKRLISDTVVMRRTYDAYSKSLLKVQDALDAARTNSDEAAAKQEAFIAALAAAEAADVQVEQAQQAVDLIQSAVQADLLASQHMAQSQEAARLAGISKGLAVALAAHHEVSALHQAILTADETETSSRQKAQFAHKALPQVNALLRAVVSLHDVDQSAATLDRAIRSKATADAAVLRASILRPVVAATTQAMMALHAAAVDRRALVTALGRASETLVVKETLERARKSAAGVSGHLQGLLDVRVTENGLIKADQAERSSAIRTGQLQQATRSITTMSGSLSESLHVRTSHDELVASASQYDQSRRRADTLAAVHGNIARTWQPLEALREVRLASQSLETVVSIHTETMAKRRRLAALQAELVVIDTQVRETVGHCPTCSQPLTPNHVHGVRQAA